MKNWIISCLAIALIGGAATAFAGDPPVAPTRVAISVDGLKGKQLVSRLKLELKKIDGVQDVGVKKGTVILLVGEDKTFRYIALKNVLKDLSTEDKPLKINDESIMLKGEVVVQIGGLEWAPKADYASALKGVKGLKKVVAVKKAKATFMITVNPKKKKGVKLSDLNAAVASVTKKKDKPFIEDVTWAGPTKKKKDPKA